MNNYLVHVPGNKKMYSKWLNLVVATTCMCFTVGVGTTCDVRLLVVVSAQHVWTRNVKHTLHRHFKRSIFKSRRFNYSFQTNASYVSCYVAAAADTRCRK